MEQIFGVFGLDIRLLIVQMINFGIVLAVLTYFLYRPFLNMIEKRRSDTIEAVANAERAASELAEADTKKKEIITKANLEAEDIVKTARDAGKEKETDIITEAMRRSDQILADAHSQGDETKRQYIAESKEEIAKLIVLGVEKTLKEKTS